MSTWGDSIRSTGSRFGLSRYTLAGAALAIALPAIVVALVLVLGGSHHATGASARAGAASSNAVANPAALTSRSSTASRAAAASHLGKADRPATLGAAPAPAPAPAAGIAARRGASHARIGVGADGQATVNETPDPEAAKSFPAPPSVHHAAAVTPASAAAVVAPGAPSDAEVRAELAQMHAAERAAAPKALPATSSGGGSIGGNGTVTPPPGVPAIVARVIAGANAITDFPYVFGGGHASFVDNAYDCSGSISYALAAGGMLSAPETSGALESWGAPGPGQWITVYANAGHTYMYVNMGNGWMRYDTSGRSGVFGSRWQTGIRSNEGFVARHWPGL